MQNIFIFGTCVLHANCHQQLIGTWNWIVELGRIAIHNFVPRLLACLAQPREGHLRADLHMTVLTLKEWWTSIYMLPFDPNLALACRATNPKARSPRLWHSSSGKPEWNNTRCQNNLTLRAVFGWFADDDASVDSVICAKKIRRCQSFQPSILQTEWC